jgi:hypothetical protein
VLADLGFDLIETRSSRQRTAVQQHYVVMKFERIGIVVEVPLRAPRRCDPALVDDYSSAQGWTSRSGKNLRQDDLVDRPDRLGCGMKSVRLPPLGAERGCLFFGNS